MNHWAFITAAYGVVVVIGSVLALVSYLAMRRAERP